MPKYTSIGLTKEAYQILSNLRGPGESFSDLVLRLHKKKDKTQLEQVKETVPAVV